jgi:hypothetical protein
MPVDLDCSRHDFFQLRNAATGGTFTLGKKDTGFSNDYVSYAGKYYALTEQRIAYHRDKTEDDRFFTVFLEVWVASQVTVSSKFLQNRDLCLAQGTAAETTPCSLQRTHGSDDSI